jgi:hypothetical protein
MNDAAATTFLIIILKHAPSCGRTLMMLVRANCLDPTGGQHLFGSARVAAISMADFVGLRRSAARRC